MNYLSLEQCQNRFLYRLESRNLVLGVYNEKVKGFIGIREKFGDEFLFTEYHWDTGPPFGTVHPLEELKKMPDDVELRENFDTIDEKSGRKVSFDLPVSDGGKGWYFLDNGEASQEICPTSHMNQKLYDWLKENERNK